VRQHFSAYLRVKACGAYALMAKELLDYAQGYAVFQQVGGKTVPKHMRGNSLAHAGFVRGSRHDLANGPRDAWPCLARYLRRAPFGV